MKLGIECPGYQSQFDIAWRDQNVVAEKSVKRRKNANERKANQVELVRESVQISLTSGAPRLLSQDYELYAVNLFLSAYVLQPDDPEVQRGFLGCIYPVWTQSESNSPLKPAVAAVSFWMLESWSQIKPGQASSLSQLHYQKGLVALRKRMLSNDDVDDDIILAALMLDMYENVQSFRSAQSNRGPHIKGAVALLERRQRLPLTGKTSQRLLLGARQHILGRLLGNKEPVPMNALAMDDVVRDVIGTAGNRQDEFNIQVVDLQYRATQLGSDNFANTSDALGVLRKATELDQRMLNWESSTPPDWAPIPVSGNECIPPSVQRTGLYQKYCDIYKSVFIADRLNSHRSSRIRVQVIILDCLERINKSSSTAATLTSLEIIQMLADDICASVPYHLGDRTIRGRIDDKTAEYPHLLGLPVSDDHHLAASAFAGFLLTRRLGELLSLPVPLRHGQRQWMGGQIQRIKTIYGIGSAQ